MELYDFVRTSDNIRILNIEEKDIELAENRMHFRFPEELRCFYSEIGYGKDRIIRCKFFDETLNRVFMT